MSRICKEDHALGAAIIFVDVDVKMFDAFAIVVGLRDHMGTVGMCPCLLLQILYRASFRNLKLHVLSV